jgi:hypothetical protein
MKMSSNDVIYRQGLGIDRFPELLAITELFLSMFRKFRIENDTFLDQEVDEVFQQPDDPHIRQGQQQLAGIGAYGFVKKIKNFLIDYGFFFTGIWFGSAVHRNDPAFPVPLYVKHDFDPLVMVLE